MSIYGVSLKDNKEQQELARLIQEKDKHLMYGRRGDRQNPYLDRYSIRTAKSQKI